jgi:predicted O-linked N-acetylglucosamine transferase (SPINDLY family)
MTAGDPRILLAQAFAAKQAGDPARARALTLAAETLAPAEPAVLAAVATLLAETDPAGAEARVLRLVDLDPGNDGGYAFLAALFARAPRDVEAAALFEAYAARDLPAPARRTVLSALAGFRNRTGDAAGALAALEALGPRDDPALEHLRLFAALYARDMDDRAVAALKRRYDAHDPVAPRPPPPPRAGRARPRIGFAGSDLGAPNYMALFAPLLREFDPARIEVELIALGPVHPALAEWYRARGLTLVSAHDAQGADALAARIAGRDLDVLVEMDDALGRKGRAAVRRRPARVRAAWFNMTGPAGDPAYDASIGNEALYPDPSVFDEACVRLPADAFVYDPEYGPFRPPPPVPGPCEAGGRVTFGALAQPYKIGEPCLDLWAAALRAAPQTRFHLGNSAMAEDAARARFAREMGARGVDPARLSFGTDSGWPGYLKGYTRIDLAFATFPVPGGTTIFEAAYQGVLTLSLRGGHALTRIGDWLARATEAPWTACADAAEFAARAAELAADPARLIEARRTWRTALREKSRRDAPRVARALEDALLALVAGAPP